MTLGIVMHPQVYPGVFKHADVCRALCALVLVSLGADLANVDIDHYTISKSHIHQYHHWLIQKKIIQYWEAVKFMEKNGSFPNSSLFHFSNFYLFLRERKKQNVSRGEAERGRHRIWSRLQALSCQHRAWCRAWTHKPRDHDLSRSWSLNQLSYPGAPTCSKF